VIEFEQLPDGCKGFEYVGCADVLALCSAMRPVIMLDYGGKMPELQDQLCALLELIQKVFLFHLSRN